jgi:RNA polymerase sigma-70 factor, ECF subfamily
MFLDGELEDLLVSRGELDVLERQLEARDPDVRLMLQIRDDTPGAFEALVQRYQDRLVGILYHLVGSLEEAEDLSQDVFLRVYKARKGYRPRAKFSTWLFPFAQQIPSRETTASSQMRQVELSEVVREALNILGEDQRMAVLLNKFEDMSYAEIGEVMSRSSAAIKSLLARARNELREQLGAYLAMDERGTKRGSV